MYFKAIDQTAGVTPVAPIYVPERQFPSGKRNFDLIVAAIGLCLAGAIGALLLILNPLFNPGPLFFRQERMGINSERFVLWKFRTMAQSEVDPSARPALAPLETERISAFASVLRKLRIDELPNFINVWRGEMSVIGPRPDAWEHAEYFWNTIPRYKERFRVRPGITGLAQICIGYADSSNATRRKARFDHFYVSAWSLKMELFIIWRTAFVVLSGYGAK